MPLHLLIHFIRLHTPSIGWFSAIPWLILRLVKKWERENDNDRSADDEYFHHDQHRRRLRCHHHSMRHIQLVISVSVYLWRKHKDVTASIFINNTIMDIQLDDGLN